MKEFRNKGYTDRSDDDDDDGDYTTDQLAEYIHTMFPRY